MCSGGGGAHTHIRYAEDAYYTHMQKPYMELNDLQNPSNGSYVHTAICYRTTFSDNYNDEGMMGGGGINEPTPPPQKK